MKKKVYLILLFLIAVIVFSHKIANGEESYDLGVSQNTESSLAQNEPTTSNSDAVSDSEEFNNQMIEKYCAKETDDCGFAVNLSGCGTDCTFDEQTNQLSFKENSIDMRFMPQLKSVYFEDGKMIVETKEGVPILITSKEKTYAVVGKAIISSLDESEIIAFENEGVLYFEDATYAAQNSTFAITSDGAVLKQLNSAAQIYPGEICIDSNTEFELPSTPGVGAVIADITGNAGNTVWDIALKRIGSCSSSSSAKTKTTKAGEITPYVKSISVSETAQRDFNKLDTNVNYKENEYEFKSEDGVFELSGAPNKYLTVGHLRDNDLIDVIICKVQVASDGSCEGNVKETYTYKVETIGDTNTKDKSKRAFLLRPFNQDSIQVEKRTPPIVSGFTKDGTPTVIVLFPSSQKQFYDKLKKK